MRPTIKDIAAQAGISISAVSTILNNKPSRISEATKEKVMRIATEMNYRPNQAAVSLKNNRSFTLGLIIPDISNGFYANMAKGVEAESRCQGWNVILCNAGDSARRQQEYVEVLASKGVDGIVMTPVSNASLAETQRASDRLIALGIPFVQFDRSALTPMSNATVANHEEGGYMATKHLIDLGHRRIACITGSLYLEGAASRLEGYKRALSEHGIPLDEDIIYQGDYRAESGRKAMEYLEGKDFSAVFSFNDYMAYYVYQYLREHGHRVPEDCSIVGYDDDAFSVIISPPLTTIHQPIYDMGRNAAQIIFAIVDKKQKQPIINEFKLELRVRGSTAPYQKNKKEG